LAIRYAVPRAEPDRISLDLLSGDGVTVESWNAEEPDEDAEIVPDGDWSCLYGLYSEVHRFVTGWDKVMDDVEKSLTTPGPIGREPVRGLAQTINHVVGIAHAATQGELA